MTEAAVAEALASIPPEVIGAAKLGGVWPQHWVKYELNRILPPKEAFEEFRRILELPASMHLQRQPVRSLHAAALAHAADYSELEPSGEPFVNVPPVVLGEGDHRLLRCTARTRFVASFLDVTTRGRSGLITLGDELLLDFEGEEYERIDDELELDSYVFRGEREKAWAIVEGDGSRALQIDEALSLLGPNSVAFGHWIDDYLPKLECAIRSGIVPPIPLLIDAGMPRQHRQAVELIMLPGMEIVEVPPMQDVYARKLWTAPTFHYAPVLPKMNHRFRYDFVATPPARFVRSMHAMLERMMPAVGPTSGTKRIFLARKPANKRRLVNREAIEAIALRHGFELIYLEDLDFVEQIRVVRNARFVAGPEGSAFFVCFFARPGTRLCLLEPSHTEPLVCVTALLDALGMDCTVLTGPFHREHPHYRLHGDYEIGEEAFASFLERWLAEPGNA